MDWFLYDKTYIMKELNSNEIVNVDIVKLDHFDLEERI